MDHAEEVVDEDPCVEVAEFHQCDVDHRLVDHPSVHHAVVPILVVDHPSVHHTVVPVLVVDHPSVHHAVVVQVSILHIALQPSPETRFPSSHCSGAIIIPSQHIGLQTLKVVHTLVHAFFEHSDTHCFIILHSYQGSIVHTLLHPSQSILFPSSHCSHASIFQLPHIVDSILQFAEHQSPETRFPSSHCSHHTTKVSPQIALQFTVGHCVHHPSFVHVPNVSQDQPCSSIQLLLQPSPETIFPSSQVSGACISLSPHNVDGKLQVVRHSFSHIVVSRSLAIHDSIHCFASDIVQDPGLQSLLHHSLQDT